MFFPYPYKIFSNVTEITPEVLNKEGIKAIILDIDGTLMKTKDKWPKEEVMAWIHNLKSNGILFYVLSNNKHPQRVKSFAESIGAEWSYLSRKPFKKGFIKAAIRVSDRRFCQLLPLPTNYGSHRSSDIFFDTAASSGFP